MSLFLPQEVQTLWVASLLLWLSWEGMQGSWCLEPLQYVHTMPVSEARNENCWGWPQGGADWELLILAPLKACSYIFSPSFLFSLPPSLSPFALDLSIQLVYTMEMEDSLRSQGWKVSVCVKTCLLTVHPFMTVCNLMTTCVWEAYACASGISDGCGTMTVTLGS